MLIAPSNRCESLLVVAPKHTPAADSACALIDFRGDQHPLPIGVLREGECDWLDVQPSGALGSGPAAAPGCTGIDELSLTVNAENFNERGRVDLVAFVPQTRCYVFISAVQQPDRVEPFQFGPGEACVIRHSQSPQGDLQRHRLLDRSRPRRRVDAAGSRSGRGADSPRKPRSAALSHRAILRLSASHL